MIKLGVNIDHVATLRQVRLAKEPNLIKAAVLAELAGANGITVHLREDRRHIQTNDVKLLREVITTRLNLEMATNEDVLNVALQVKPDMATLVPEKRQELTTEGGLNILDEKVNEKTIYTVKKLQERGIIVSLFIDPKPEIMKIAKATGAEFIEIHTGKYSEAKNEKEKKEELEKIIEAVKSAKALGLSVNAGHGLDYENVQEIAEIAEIEELNIGHSIIARSIVEGLPNAIKEMKELICGARKNG
ncbi:pyridoxine 5'-phosphate synthase [Haliovirga abyssi]|uniref:Pyridoxine 5'-phosphate synthase n=1 Tax=Haliovirga abyssi TaxID=2996794 RepID=A0AAU9DKT7_9FUSO|nr:pyridoxine 5'-phosphate synthase [Haliovirga abyssi]BDU50532.1 pyridoxine 5'-phosphate synthase [Haliovirga abyssi]